MTIQMDTIQTTGFAVLVATIGSLIQRRVPFLKRVAIPAPVIGGVLFAIVNTILRVSGVLEIEFDQTLQDFFQTLFFTTIGFTASVKMLQSNGVRAGKLLGLTIALILIQNFIAIGIGSLVGLPPLLSLLSGSSALVGGPGTTGAVAPTIAEFGYSSALTIGFAAATFGIISGGLMGGPFAATAISHRGLTPPDRDIASNDLLADVQSVEGSEDKISGTHLVNTFLLLLVVAFFGTYLTDALNYLLGFLFDQVTLPNYLGAAFLAFIIRNISDHSENFSIPMDEVNVLSELVLKIFLAMALLNLQLWELRNIGLRMLLILVTQVVVVWLYAYYIALPFLGKDYDAMMTTTGLIGFGLGASYNAVASMTEVTNRFGPSSRTAVIIPLVTSIFSDFINVILIYLFIGFID